MTVTLLASKSVTPSSVTALPAGVLGSWGYAGNAGNFGSGAGAMLPNAGLGTFVTTQQTYTCYLNTVPTSCVQYISPPLAAQSIGSGNWILGFAISNPSTWTWQGYASLLLANGATGAIRSAIFNVTAVGAVKNSAYTETGAYSPALSGGAVVAVAGDYLVLEIGASNNNSNGMSCSVCDSGNTSVVSDGATYSSARSYLTSPGGALLFLTSAGGGNRTNLQGGFLN